MVEQLRKYQEFLKNEKEEVVLEKEAFDPKEDEELKKKIMEKEEQD